MPCYLCFILLIWFLNLTSLNDLIVYLKSLELFNSVLSPQWTSCHSNCYWYSCYWYESAYYSIYVGSFAASYLFHHFKKWHLLLNHPTNYLLLFVTLDKTISWTQATLKGSDTSLERIRNRRIPWILFSSTSGSFLVYFYELWFKCQAIEIFVGKVWFCKEFLDLSEGQTSKCRILQVREYCY